MKERMETESVGTIMDQLFPQPPQHWWSHPGGEDEKGPPLWTAEEIDAAVDRVRAKAKKAPGPDGIPNSVWTIVHRANPGILDAVFNIALKSGVFPTRWKVAQLAGAIAKIWQTSQEPNLVSATLHATYDRENLRAGCRGAAEEALLGKACFERQYGFRGGC